MHVHCTMTRSTIPAVLVWVTAAFVTAAPCPATAVPIVTINEINSRPNETIANPRPAGIDMVPLGNYRSTGEARDADTFTVAMVNGRKTITNFFSDPATDNSPADTDRVVIGNPLNPTLIIEIKSPAEGVGTPEIPEPGALALMGLGLVALLRVIGWRRLSTPGSRELGHGSVAGESREAG